MTASRTDLYRLLHVQPEAPAEVIKASYRALMSAARMHPDLGGDTARAAELNVAYGVLSDPAQRRAYDLSRRDTAAKPAAARSAQATQAAPHDVSQWLARRECPFCRARLPGTPAAGMRCGCCDSPLMPAPTGSARRPELIGRRGHERFVRDQLVALHLPGHTAPRSARLRDLSLTGLSILADLQIAKGAALRINAPAFDTVAAVVTSRRASGLWTIHARLCTLHFDRSARGSLVSVKA